ncbi:MAG: HAD-IIB family hydrolase [Acidobacteria bacterium]|nr:HAD-IIB family hydrolase [Acidobacteriota bacterium]
MSSRKPLIYTDLDGTLLDHKTYSFAESLPALAAAQDRGIPVIFCSSKTRSEIEHLRRQTQVKAPFIIENGGAVIIPAGYFPFFTAEQTQTGHPTLAFGTPYQTLVSKMQELQSAFPGRIVSFYEMTEEEVARDCSLTLEEARRAKQREFDEPFRLVNSDADMVIRITDTIRQLGLFCSQGGRFYHLHGHNDKGAAVRILTHLFQQAYGDVFTVALGDSLNDLPMLASVDYPILVKKPSGKHDATLIKLLPNVHLADGIGPKGWREAVTDLLDILAADC